MQRRRSISLLKFEFQDMNVGSDKFRPESSHMTVMKLKVPNQFSRSKQSIHKGISIIQDNLARRIETLLR
jgi:hypothetical protein